MLLQIGPNLEEEIVSRLADTPLLKAAELRRLTGSSKKQYSIQAVYKALRNLQRTGVVVKVAKHYTLRMAWVHELVNFADTLYDHYLEKPPDKKSLPAENESLSWRFSDLKKADDFTVQLIFLLYGASSKKIMFEWTAHPWFQLLQKQKEEQFVKAMRLAGYRMYCIIGGCGFLDTVFANIYPPEVIKLAYAESPFHQMRSKHIFLIGDYIFTVTLDRETVKRLEEIYSGTISMEDLDFRALMDLFNTPKNIKAVLDHKPARAKSMRRRFCSYFGLKEDEAA